MNKPGLSKLGRIKDAIKFIRKSMMESMEFVPSATITDVNKLYKGAHIKFRRWNAYAHHAIVTDINVKDSKYTVIHFNSDQKHDFKRKSKIMEMEKEFGEHETVLLVNYNIDELLIPHFKRLPTHASISVAEYFRDDQYATSYSLLTNNCEHFVFSCTTGYAVSFQTIKPLVLAFWATKKISDTAVNALVEFLVRRKKKTVEYHEGDDFVYITLDTEKVKHPITGLQSNI